MGEQIPRPEDSTGQPGTSYPAVSSSTAHDDQRGPAPASSTGNGDQGGATGGTGPGNAAGAGNPEASPARRTSVGLIVTVCLLGLALLASLGVAGVALAASAAASGSRAATGTWPNSAVTPAVREAKRCVAALLSVSAKTASRDIRRVVACGTGEFGREYRGSEELVRTAVVNGDVTATATVRTAAVVTAAEDSVVVLVAVDAMIRNKKAPEGSKRRYRVSVDMRRVDDGWKISELRFV